MQKISLLKISVCGLFLIFLFSGLCMASEEEDAINELISQSLAMDMSENETKSKTDFLSSEKDQESADVESQLKDIERDYLAKIDSIAVGQKDDDLANNLVENDKKSLHLAAKHAKDFATKDSGNKKGTQQDVSDFVRDTSSSSKEDLSGFILKDSAKTEDLGFEAHDLGEAVAKLSMIDGMKNNIEQNKDGSVALFKGECLTCEKEYGSDIKNCCNLTGIFKNIVGPRCPRHVTEVLVPAVVRDKRCHQVSDFYCIARYPWYLGKGCRKWRKTFCCYQSNLGRIFQQIAHHQLGISWGNGDHPNCGPLDPKTFSKLNFDDPYAKKLLQEELVGGINNNASKYIDNTNVQTAKSSAEITNKIKALQDRISDYFKVQGGKR